MKTNRVWLLRIRGETSISRHSCTVSPVGQSFRKKQRGHEIDSHHPQIFFKVEKEKMGRAQDAAGVCAGLFRCLEPALKAPFRKCRWLLSFLSHLAQSQRCPTAAGYPPLSLPAAPTTPRHAAPPLGSARPCKTMDAVAGAPPADRCGPGPRHRAGPQPLCSSTDARSPHKTCSLRP